MAEELSKCIDEAKDSLEAIKEIIYCLNNCAASRVRRLNKVLNSIIQLVEHIRTNLVTAILREAQTTLTRTASSRERRKYAGYNRRRQVYQREFRARGQDFGNIREMMKNNLPLHNLKVDACIFGSPQPFEVESFNQELESVKQGLQSIQCKASCLTASEENASLVLVGGYRSPRRVSFYNPVRDSWSSGAPIGVGREKAAAAMWNAKVIVAGGWLRREKKVTASVEQFDPQTNTWTTMGNLLVARCHHSLINADGSLYVIGGSGDCYLDRGESLSSAECYDAASSSWQTAFELENARKGLASAALRGFIIVTGGLSNANDALSSCEKSGINGSHQMAAMYFRRAGHAAAAYVDSIYVFGGSQSATKPCAQCELYDWHAQRWTVLQTRLAVPRFNLNSVCLGSAIYLIGGKNQAGVKLQMEQFDDHSKRFKQAAALPELDSDMAVTSVHFTRLSKQNKLVNKGGRNLKLTDSSGKDCSPTASVMNRLLMFCIGHKQEHNATASVYDLNSKRRFFVSKMNNVHDRTAAVTWNNTVIVAGGETEPHETTDSVEQFDLQTGKWTALPNLVTSCCDHALVNVDGILYVFGGWNGQDFLDSVEQYDANSQCWQVRHPLGIKRSEFAAANTTRGIVISGGLGAESSCELFDAVRNCSTPISALNCSRRTHAAATHNDTVYVFGGWGYDSLAEVEQYDAGANRWTLLKVRLSQARSDLAAACVDGKIYIVGGLELEWKAMDVFDPMKMQCSQITLPLAKLETQAVAFLSVTNDQLEQIVERQTTELYED